METRKIVLLFLSFSLLLSSCSFFSKYGEIEYNNLVVEGINESSLAIEETANLYNQTLPDVVTEKDVIDVSEMESAHNDAKQLFNKTNNLLSLESRNLEQQAAVRTELETYISAGNLYLESYAKMLTYFEEGTYQEDITQVESIDETLHTHYTTFIESNNDLVDTLESFLNLGSNENL